MKYLVKLWQPSGICYSYYVTKNKMITLKDGSIIQTLFEISNFGVIHIIDDSGVEIYSNGIYFITSEEGHYEY